MMTPAPANLAYFLETSAENYFGIQNEPDGYWLGTAANQLNLIGVAETKHIANLAAGYLPDGSVSLVQQQNYSTRSRQPGWDLTFNAPKSVSIAFALANDQTRREIRQAHTVAIKRAFQYLEEHGALTRRKNDGDVVFERANLIAVAFEHASSRNLDPHLHTHLVVLNVAFRSDGTTGTVYSRPFWNLQKAAGAIYRATLATELIERNVDGLRKGAHSFELESIPESDLKKWSTRRSEILAVEKLLAQDSAKARDIIAHKTRNEKTSVSRTELFVKWYHRSIENGTYICLGDSPPLSVAESKFHAQFAVSTAIEKLASRQSFFTHNSVIEHALSHTEHLGISVDTVISEIQSAKIDGLLVDIGSHKEKTYFSTPSILKAEAELIQSVNRSREKLSVISVNPSDGNSIVENLIQYTSEKASKLVAIAVTPKAAAEFSKRNSVESMTAARLLYHQDLAQNSTLLVTNPSSLPTLQLLEIVRLATDRDSQIVFLDATRRSVAFGPKGGFEIIKNEIAPEMEEGGGQCLGDTSNLHVQTLGTLEKAVSILAMQLVDNYLPDHFSPALVPSREIAFLLNDSCQRQHRKRNGTHPILYASLGTGEKAYVGDQIHFFRNLLDNGIQTSQQVEVVDLNPARNAVTVRSEKGLRKLPFAALTWASLAYAIPAKQARELDGPAKFLLIDSQSTLPINVDVDERTKIISFERNPLDTKEPRIDHQKLLESRLVSTNYQHKSATQMQLELQQQGI